METACPTCTIPLVDPVGATAALSSIVLFRCGHSFHQLCAPEGVCALCLHNRVGRLLTASTEALVALPSGAGGAR